MHVEALNPRTALSPKLRDTCSPKQGRDSVSPRQDTASPKARREGDERKVMLGPRKMIPVKRAQPMYSGWKWEGEPTYKQATSLVGPHKSSQITKA